MRWFLGVCIVMGCCLGTSTGTVLQAQDDTPHDWPTVIAQLTQQLYQRPGHTHTRQQLAIAHNNYGVSLSQEGKLELAVTELQEAVRLDEAESSFRNNLSNTYLAQAQQTYQQHDPRKALAILDKVTSLTPTVATAYVLRGEIEYGQQRLKEAKIAWQRAMELDPTVPGLTERLAQVTEELPVESEFERLSQAYFDLRYQDQLDRSVGFDIQAALSDARRIVGSNFSYWPRYKLVVLIYSAESFRKLRQETPEWVAGQFDGKIRVPLPDNQLNQAMVRQILFHEYTHAVIHALTHGACPVWLNEGLAEYEGRSQTPGSVALLQRAYDGGTLLAWGELSGHFSTTLPAETVGLADEQSYSLVDYLVERYGFWKIRRILKAIAEGKPWEQVFAEECHVKLSRLEANWRDGLTKWLSTK